MEQNEKLMYNYKAVVNRIIDGDTVVLDIDLGFDQWSKNQSVRLYDTDTPEVRTRNDIEKLAGFLAKDEVANHLIVGSTVLLNSIEYNRGSFGRIIGRIISAENVDIGKMLKENRLATPWEGLTKEERLKLENENIQYLIDSGKIVLTEEQLSLERGDLLKRTFHNNSGKT